MNWEFCWFLWSLVLFGTTILFFFGMREALDEMKKEKRRADDAEQYADWCEGSERILRFENASLIRSLADAKWKLEDIQNKINNPSPN